MRLFPPAVALLLTLATTVVLAQGQAPQSTNTAALPNAPSSEIDTGPCIIAPNEVPAPVTFRLRTTCMVNTTFSVGALIVPAFGAAYRMANPPDNYPREWKNGAAAYGRNYGDRVARNTASGLGQFVVAAIDREDPRYYASRKPQFAKRVIHAIAFSVVDKTQSGHNTLAISNFAGAASAGFVGMAYLPDGYNDLTHAYQRTATEFSTFAAQNIAFEFYPELARFAHKLHLPVPKP